MSVVFSWFSAFLYQEDWPLRYNRNIHQYQQNKETPLILTEHKMTTT